MVNSWRDIRLGAPITERIGQYLELLFAYCNHSQWQNETILKRAVYRYETFWLPLAAEWKTTDLEPPRDVRWVWHLHLLKPKQYHSYCMAKFGHLVPHALRTSASEEKFAKERTALIWKDKYLSEPYELESDLRDERDSQRSRYSRSDGVLDLIFGATFQATFLYQVSLPHYKDKAFRNNALDRYKKFLFLWSMKPYDFNMEVVPYDIQLLWRVHVLHPLEYQRDVQALTGGQQSVLDIEDLSTFEARRTKNVYEEFYQEPLLAGGTGFRGYMICDNINSFPKDLTTHQKVDVCNIVINDLTISDIWSGEKKFLVEVKRLGDSSFSYTSIFTAEGEVGKPISSANAQTGLGGITFDSRYHRGLEFHIFGRKGRFCFKKENHIATVFYNPRDAFADGSFFTRTISANISKVTATDPNIKFIADIKATEKEATLFSLTRADFELRDIPGALRAYVDQQAVWAGVHGEEGDYPVIAARHGLKSKKGDMGFGVEIVKCDAPDLGAVMLYLNNARLVAVAHSIGPEHLPTAEQVGSEYPLSLDPTAGDKAMLIRNHTGDWAVCVARWREDENGGGEDGKVQITVYNIQTKTSEKYEIRDDEMQTLLLGHVKVDMPTGRISLAAACDSVAESVTLAFCAGILFLACQKHAIQGPNSLSGSVNSVDKLTSKSRFSNKQKIAKKKTRRRKMSASFTFLLAAGLQMDSYFYNPGSSASRLSTLTLSDVPTVVNQDGDVKFIANNNNTSSRNGGAPRATQDTRNLQKMDYLSTKSGMGATLNSLTNGRNHYIPNGGSQNVEARRPSPAFQDEEIMDIRL